MQHSGIGNRGVVIFKKTGKLGIVAHNPSTGMVR